MRVFLVRHGQAIPHMAAPSDETRWLTDVGRVGTARVGAALVDLGVRPTVIYTGPYVRAVQTTEILAQQFGAEGFTGPVEVHAGLHCERGTTAQALAPLDHADDADTIILVTHMPKVRVLASHLTGLDHFPAFPTTGVCHILWDGRVGRFQWMLSPDQLDPRADL